MVPWNKVIKEQLKIQKQQVDIQERQTEILNETKKIYFWLLLATFLMALISTIGIMKEAGANKWWLDTFYSVVIIIAISILIKLASIVDMPFGKDHYKKSKGKAS